MRELILSCRTYPPFASSPVNLPLWLAWILVLIAWLIDVVTLGRLRHKLLSLTPSAVYFMAGANFALPRDAYEVVGYTPPHSWPEGVAADLKRHAARKYSPTTTTTTTTTASTTRLLAMEAPRLNSHQSRAQGSDL